MNDTEIDKAAEAIKFGKVTQKERARFRRPAYQHTPVQAKRYTEHLKDMIISREGKKCQKKK